MSNEILKGVKILDFATMFAAPMAATFLSEFGADVIHVEWKKGDPARASLPRKDGVSLINKILNRNKRFITLDFHHEEAVELLHELVNWADVVVSNFRPESLRKFNLDYETLVKIKPDLIMLHFTAFGRTGPYAERPGFARIAESFAGLTYYTGWPDRAPSFSGNWIADGIGGIAGAYSIMLALYHKQNTGEGQLIDLSLYEPLMRIMEDFVINYSVSGQVKERAGNYNSSASPNNMYQTKDGKWMAVLGNPNMWLRLCQAMNRMDLTENPKFNTNDARVQNNLEIDQIVADWCATMTMKELDEVLIEHKVAHGPIYSAEDIVNDPHMWERESLVKMYDAELDQEVVVQNVFPKMSKTPGKIKWTGGPAGSNNEEIFLEMLKMSPERYKELQEKGAI
ncbi:MAG: CoA transferase [Oscillospiraceae bacterium]|nr:CoA transferase [Oscillospiraceae bacterium]